MLRAAKHAPLARRTIILTSQGWHGRAGGSQFGGCMSGTKTVAGSGYGNALVDSLIWGGHAWDLTKGPVRVYFGQTIQDWYDADGAAHDGMLSLGGLTLDTWNSAEKGAFRFAMS